MPPIRRGKYGQHTLAYCVQCDMMAEENCALGGHETRNIVCCARHHDELPCGTCVEEKEAVVAKQNVPSETEEATMVTEEQKS